MYIGTSSCPEPPSAGTCWMLRILWPVPGYQRLLRSVTSPPLQRESIVSVRGAATARVRRLPCAEGDRCGVEAGATLVD